MDALLFLDTAARANRQPFYALVGDEGFLRRRVRDQIITTAIGDVDPAFAVSVYPGDKLDFSTIRNDLDTLPFLSPCRIVVVTDADSFVSDNRPALEQYAGKPSGAGILVLEVSTFTETTRLARCLPDDAKIVCKAPPAFRLPAWCVGWAKVQHKRKLTSDAAELLVELVGSAMGLLDQEIEKLAVAVGKKTVIDADDVDRLVGRSKASNVFQIMDAIGDGKPGVALGILESLFTEGEDPMAILGPLTAQLRKLAAVGRLIAQGQDLRQAMDAAKVPTWEKARQSFERQVRWLGRRRLDKLTGWLVEINYGLKGGNPLPERVQVERLVVKLARPRESDKAGVQKGP
jgi:DNA polymerase-3 subunit delta